MVRVNTSTRQDHAFELVGAAQPGEVKTATGHPDQRTKTEDLKVRDMNRTLLSSLYSSGSRASRDGGRAIPTIDPEQGRS